MPIPEEISLGEEDIYSIKPKCILVPDISTECLREKAINSAKASEDFKSDNLTKP